MKLMDATRTILRAQNLIEDSIRENSDDKDPALEVWRELEELKSFLYTLERTLSRDYSLPPA